MHFPAFAFKLFSFLLKPQLSLYFFYYHILMSSNLLAKAHYDTIPAAFNVDYGFDIIKMTIFQLKYMIIFRPQFLNRMRKPTYEFSYKVSLP